MKNLKIFVVDNDLSVLNYYQQCLESLGYDNIQLFLNGKTCMNNLHQEPAVVFLNRDMDEKTASEVLEKIRHYDPIISVVILSDNKQAKKVLDVLNYNICDYIIKDEEGMKKIEATLKSITSTNKVFYAKARILN